MVVTRSKSSKDCTSISSKRCYASSKPSIAKTLVRTAKSSIRPTGKSPVRVSGITQAPVAKSRKAAQTKGTTRKTTKQPVILLPSKRAVTLTRRKPTIQIDMREDVHDEEESPRPAAATISALNNSSIGAGRKRPPFDHHDTSCLPGREQEFDELRRILRASISACQGTCVYVSGVPGTGKTATIRNCIASVRAENDTFDAVELNAMRLKTTKALYEHLWHSFYPEAKRAKARTTKPEMQRLFTADTRMAVLLVDELDLLISDASLYRLFEWPSTARLVVIAVANTMDLPERFLSTRIASRLGLCRMNFCPYGHAQLATIVAHRLQADANANGMITADALEYLSRRIAAVSGDARRAIGMAEQAISYGRKNNIRLTIDVMMAAVGSMSATITPSTVISDLSPAHKQILAAILRCTNDGTEARSVECIVERYWQQCRTDGHSLGSFVKCNGLLVDLIAAGIVASVDRRRRVDQCSLLALAVGNEDVEEALKVVAAPSS